MRPYLVATIIAACAAPSAIAPRATSPSSRGMRADAHLEAARAHEARAAQLARWPEMQRDAAGFEDPASGLWYRGLDTARLAQQLAQSHRSEAARLHAEYDDACAGMSGADVTVSPLHRYGVTGMSTATGAIVVLSREAGPPDRLMAAMRCHRAWMMLGEAGMEDCPLDLRDITVQVYGDETGISVEIAASDRTLIPELQRRVAANTRHGETP